MWCCRKPVNRKLKPVPYFWRTHTSPFLCCVWHSLYSESWCDRVSSHFLVFQLMRNVVLQTVDRTKAESWTQCRSSVTNIQPCAATKGWVQRSPFRRMTGVQCASVCVPATSKAHSVEMEDDHWCNSAIHQGERRYLSTNSDLLVLALFIWNFTLQTIMPHLVVFYINYIQRISNALGTEDYGVRKTS